MANAVAATMYYEFTVNRGVLLGRTLGPYGIAHIVITAAEHSIRIHGNLAPLPQPAPYNDSESAVTTNKKRQFDKYDFEETTCRSKTKTLVIPET